MKIRHLTASAWLRETRKVGQKVPWLLPKSPTKENCMGNFKGVSGLGFRILNLLRSLNFAVGACHIFRIIQGYQIILKNQLFHNFFGNQSALLLTSIDILWNDLIKIASHLWILILDKDLGSLRHESNSNSNCMHFVLHILTVIAFGCLFFLILLLPSKCSWWDWFIIFLDSFFFVF